MIFFNTKLHFIHTNRLEAGVYLNTSQLAVISSVKKELTLTASLLLATAEKSNNRSIEIPQNSFALVPQVTYKSINFWVKVKSLNLHRLYIHHMAGFFFASFPQVSPYLGQQPGQVANLTQPSPHQRGMKLRQTPAKLVFLWCPRHFTCFSNGYDQAQSPRLHTVAHGCTWWYFSSDQA